MSANLTLESTKAPSCILNY